MAPTTKVCTFPTAPDTWHYRNGSYNAWYMTLQQWLLQRLIHDTTAMAPTTSDTWHNSNGSHNAWYMTLQQWLPQRLIHDTTAMAPTTPDTWHYSNGSHNVWYMTQQQWLPKRLIHDTTAMAPTTLSPSQTATNIHKLWGPLIAMFTREGAAEDLGLHEGSSNTLCSRNGCDVKISNKIGAKSKWYVMVSEEDFSSLQINCIFRVFIIDAVKH